MYRLIGLAAAVLLLAPPRPCAAQTALEWEFEETSYIDVNHVAKQEITVFGKTKEMDTTIRFLFKVRPVRVNRTATVLELTVLACDDTSATNGAEPETGTFKGYRGQKFRLTARAANQGIELAAPKGLAEALFGEDAKSGTDAEKKFAAEMAETILRVHLLDAFVPLPGKAVSAGDKWRNAAEVKLQPLAHLTADREYILLGRQVHEGKRVEAIGWTSRVDLKPLRDEKGLFPFKVKEMKPVGKIQNEGTALWDGAANRPVRVDSIQAYELDMTLDIDGEDVKAKGKGTDTFVVRYFAKNPDEK